MLCFHVIACIDANIIRQCFVFHQAPRQELLRFGSRIDARRFACKVLKETVDHKHKFQSTTLSLWRRIDSGMQTNKVLQVPVYQDLSAILETISWMIRGQVSNICQIMGQALKAIKALLLFRRRTCPCLWHWKGHEGTPMKLATSGWHYIKYVTKHSDLVRQKRKNDVEMSAIYRHLLSKMFCRNF